MGLIVWIVWIERPRLPDRSEQIFEARPERPTLRRTRDLYPVRIGVPRRLKCPQLTKEPSDNGRRRGRKEKSEGPSEGTDRQIGQCRLRLAIPSQFDGLERVDEAGEDEKARDPCRSRGDESEERLLHPVAGSPIAPGWLSGVTNETEAHVTEHDKDSSNPSQSLQSSSPTVVSLDLF